MKKLKTFEESINFFKEHSLKTNQYFLKIQGKKYPSKIHTLENEGYCLKKEATKDNGVCLVVKDEAIRRFHPNSIDNKFFWKIAKDKFPYLSVCGQKSNSFKETNENTLCMSRETGILGFVESKLNPNFKILEIGFGYGGFFRIVRKKCRYWGIDYNKPKFLSKYENLIEINRSGIPRNLMKKDFYDMVYSVNVLQHCSQKDRFAYFRQVGKVLKAGGYFAFTAFVMTEENKNSNLFGIKDEKGRGYAHFFNQLTEVDRDFEIRNEVKKCGMEIFAERIYGNFLVAICRKS